MKRKLLVFIYYHLIQYLPTNNTRLGRLTFSKQIRYWICKRIFKKIGKNVNVQRKASFGDGRNVEIGDNSGIGINANVPNNIKIGNDVMIGPNFFVFHRNHCFDSTEIPMLRQGYKSDYPPTVIEDDVWIGQNVTVTPGRHISKGSVIGACCFLCKDFPSYSVIGGNPSKLIKTRK